MPNPGEGHVYYERPPAFQARVWDDTQETLDFLQGFIESDVLQYDPESHALSMWGVLTVEPGWWLVDRSGWIDMVPTDEMFAAKYAADSPQNTLTAGTGGDTASIEGGTGDGQ